MDFQGFQHILPGAVIVLLIVGLLVLSWVSYRKFESIPTLARWGLIALRGLTLTLILLLLLNPYFYSSQEVEIKPNIAVFLDNSESIGITKGEYDGLNSYNNLLNSLNFDAIELADFNFYSIGESVSEFSPDSLNASETQTNLSEPVQSVLEMEEEVQAAVLITDGIITYGRNPSIIAFNSSIPLYTIGIGDTSRVRDISVSNILTNTTGYINTNHIIDAEISQSGFQNNTILVSLISGDGEVLQEQQVTFDTGDQVKQVQFELELQKTGLQQFEIRSEPLPDEWTDSNNSRLFSIEVLDSRVKILHVAFQIHPDVKAIRSILNSDENNELTTLTWLGGNRFVEDLPEEDEFNLIVIHGAPNTNREFSFLKNLDETPTVFFEIAPEFRNRFTSRGNVQLINIRTNQVSLINFRPLLSPDEHPILELPEINLGDITPLKSPLRSELSELQSIALYGINFDGVETDYPAIAILERGNIRRAHVLPWGWFRLLQSTNPTHREYGKTLISNLISWTSSDPDNRKLRITPAKQTFSTAEPPIINGSLLNERGDPEDDGIIEVQLESAQGSSRTFNMENMGKGNYRLELPRLSEGLYQYTATARRGNRELETQNGEFLVSNTSSELTNTLRNDELLRAIANNSGGLFFTYQNVGSFWDSLRAVNIMETQTATVENYSFPVRSMYWFFVVLLLLGSEWMLRKYYSLP